MWDAGVTFTAGMSEPGARPVKSADYFLFCLLFSFLQFLIVYFIFYIELIGCHLSAEGELVRRRRRGAPV